MKSQSLTNISTMEVSSVILTQTLTTITSLMTHGTVNTAWKTIIHMITDTTDGHQSTMERPTTQAHNIMDKDIWVDIMTFKDTTESGKAPMETLKATMQT